MALEQLLVVESALPLPALGGVVVRPDPPASAAVRALPSAASGSPNFTPCSSSSSAQVASMSGVTISR